MRDCYPDFYAVDCIIAIAALPDKLAKRIYASCFLGMRKSATAKAEGVSKVASEAIKQGIF